MTSPVESESGCGTPAVWAMVGLALVVGSVWHLVLVESFHARSASATGRVVEVQQARAEYDSADVTVQFWDSGRVLRRAVVDTGGEVTSLKVGAQVQIRYDRDDPSNARGDVYRASAWRSGALSFALGVIFLTAAIRAFSRA